MSGLSFDEATSKRLERMYSTRDMLRRRRLVREALAAAPGERILDVGCGPGFYVAELLDEVGPGGSLVGVDSSPHMLALARRRCEGRPNVDFREGDASSPPVDDADFDAALCVQVLEYIPDVTGALIEMRRALRPGGRIVVWDVDWATVSWHSSEPVRMGRVLRAFDEHLAHPSLPRTLPARMRAAGFDDVGVAGHAFSTAELTFEAYAGAIMPLIADFVPGRQGVTEEETRAWAAEQRDLAARGEFFFACIQFCFTATAPQSP
jgi:arsenite methyltransferase